MVPREREKRLAEAAHDFVAWATNTANFTGPENMLVCVEWDNLLAALATTVECTP